MMKLALREERASREANASGRPDQGRVRSRPLLLMERTMYRDGHTPFTSVFSIKLRGNLDECRLRNALRRVQLKHALLQCVVDEDDLWERPRFVLHDDPAAIPLRIVDRLSEDQWEEKVRREWIRPFQGASGPLVRLVWLRGSGIHNLILAGHHCICDGQAGIGLLQDVLRACGDPECDLGFCDEICRLEDIVPGAILQDPKFHRRLRWKRRSLECILWWNTRHRTRPAPIDAETMYFDRCLLGPKIAQSIAERSKIEEVTLLAPLALAFMQAFRDVRGTEAFKKVSAMVNARRFVDRIRPDGLFGLAPGVRMRVKDLPPPCSMGMNTFWKRARGLKAELDKRVDHLGAVFYQNLLSLEGLHHNYNRVVDFFEQAPAIRHLTFSNVGRLALGTQYGDLRLEKVYSPLVMVSPTPANTVVLSSFAGEMEFAIISDEQSLPSADAAAISRRTTEILQACVVSSI
jgi:Condensation domain